MRSNTNNDFRIPRRAAQERGCTGIKLRTDWAGGTSLPREERYSRVLSGGPPFR